MATSSTSVTDLLAQLWKGPAQIGEGRIIHNVPVKNVNLVHGHGFLHTHTHTKDMNKNHNRKSIEHKKEK